VRPVSEEKDEIMDRFKPLAVATMLAMSSAPALAQTADPPTTEQMKKPGTTSPAPAVTPAVAPAGSGVQPEGNTTPPVDVTTQADDAGGLTQSPGDLASSKLVGASVYNTNNENIGEIEDLIISSNGTVSTVVIGVGGFLGIGEKKVAMPFSALKAEKGDNNLMKVVIEGTKESLKAMPDYKYASASPS
jgi:sporulation protein YlmC with PRC-barrel domain